MCGLTLKNAELTQAMIDELTTTIANMPVSEDNPGLERNDFDRLLSETNDTNSFINDNIINA